MVRFAGHFFAHRSLLFLLLLYEVSLIRVSYFRFSVPIESSGTLDELKQEQNHIPDDWARYDEFYGWIYYKWDGLSVSGFELVEIPSPHERINQLTTFDFG